MPKGYRDILTAPGGYRSKEAALFLAQMDELSQRMARDVSDIQPAELQWQPARGMNTIGMLLAHIALVEAWWIHFGVLGQEDYQTDPVLGLEANADGIPLEPGGSAPAPLRGKDLDFFAALLSRAREHTRAAARRLATSELERPYSRRRARGRVDSMNSRWVLYHLLEHFAGHYGQILLLRHQYRTRRRR